MRASPVSLAAPGTHTTHTQRNSRVKKGEIRQGLGFQGWPVDGRLYKHAALSHDISLSTHCCRFKAYYPANLCGVFIETAGQKLDETKERFFFHFKSGKMEKRWKIRVKLKGENSSLHKEFSELSVRTVKINLYVYIQMYKSCSFCTTVSVLMFPSCVPPPNNISFKGTAGEKKNFRRLHSLPLRPPCALLSPPQKNSSSPSNVV